MSFGGVLIDRGCGLSPEVAGVGVEVKRADAVFAVLAGESDAVLDSLDTVRFHCLNCISLARTQCAR